MRKSIFEIENRLDINNEFKKIMTMLLKKNTIYRGVYYYSYFEYIDKYIFNQWPYRDTFIDTDEYLLHIGISNQQVINDKIDEGNFLNLLEFILNLSKLFKNEIDNSRSTINDQKLISILDHNIPLILEKMNYKAININNRIEIIKRDSDVDSVLELVPEDIALVLLSYNDIRIKDNIDEKKHILKQIDLYIETNKNKYRSLDKRLLDTIGTIVDEMGINHVIKKDKYKKLSNKELLEWYDKCFLLMIHLIRLETINKIKNERTELVNE